MVLGDSLLPQRPSVISLRSPGGNTDQIHFDKGFFKGKKPFSCRTAKTFLRRLEKSKHAENLVLKGGLLIYSLTEFDSPVTIGVDFLLRKIPNTPEQVKAILEEIVAADTDAT